MDEALRSTSMDGLHPELWLEREVSFTRGIEYKFNMISIVTLQFGVHAFCLQRGAGGF